jgi:hypothetical protein
MQDIGASVLGAVQNIAELTDFQASTTHPTTEAGGVGDAMLKRFQKIDEMFLQPAFGKHGRQVSDEIANVADGIHPESQKSEVSGQGSEAAAGNRSHDSK